MRESSLDMLPQEGKNDMTPWNSHKARQDDE